MGTAKTAAPSSGLYFCLLRGHLCHPRVTTILGHILKEFGDCVLLEEKQLWWPAACWCQFARLAFVIGTVVISVFHSRFLIFGSAVTSVTGSGLLFPSRVFIREPGSVNALLPLVHLFSRPSLGVYPCLSVSSVTDHLKSRTCRGKTWV